MAYCAQADLIERFGSLELAQLTDESAATSIDAAEIVKACDEASSLVDGYLSTRYTTPLLSVPTIVRKWACDIARKFLWKDRAGSDSAVTANYEYALAQMKDVAKGILGLPDDTGLLPGGSTGASLAVVTSTRFFSDTLLDYMPG